MAEVKKKDLPLKLSIIIPAYNEEETIEEVINKVVDLELAKEVIVVNDGSGDKTGQILKNFQRKYPLRVFTHRKNQGKGAAIKTGIAVAQGEYVIVQDADLEYDPCEILKLLRVADEKKAQVVYGSRFTGQVRKMSLSFRLGNIFLTFLTNLFFGSQLTDMETCYKLFRRKLIQNIGWQAKSFDFEPEITARILKRKIKIYETPIGYTARKKFEGKKISWGDGVKAVRVLLRLKFLR